MKELFKSFAKDILKYLLGLAAVAAVIGVILFFSTRPQISGSILGRVSMEDGAFTLDGLEKGMSEAEVRAILDERELFYFSPDESQSYGTLVKDRWLTVSDEERIDELGRVTIRRTYYFDNDQLTHIDLETVAVKNRVKDDLERLEGLIQTLEEAFGEVDLHFGEVLGDLGETHFTWEGEGTSSLYLKSYYYELEDWVKLSKNASSTYTEHLDILIRITL